MSKTERLYYIDSRFLNMTGEMWQKFDVITDKMFSAQDFLDKIGLPSVEKYRWNEITRDCDLTSPEMQDFSEEIHTLWRQQNANKN